MNAEAEEDVPEPAIVTLFKTHAVDAEKIPVPEVAKVLVTVRIFVDALVRFPPVCTVTLSTE